MERFDSEQSTHRSQDIIVGRNLGNILKCRTNEGCVYDVIDSTGLHANVAALLNE